MAASSKPRVVGFNHIAIEVGDIDEALAFYGRLFRFELRGKSDLMAFIDLGDQFIALQKGRRQPADDGRHFGLVVDDKEAARKALKAAGVTVIDGPFLDFRDPWGNRVEIVGYDNIQFTKLRDVVQRGGMQGHAVLAEQQEVADAACLTSLVFKSPCSHDTVAKPLCPVSKPRLVFHNINHRFVSPLCLA